MPLLRGTQLRGISTTSTLQELVQAPKVTRPSPQVFRPTCAKEDARLKLNRVITTVDPARLSESDFLDLAGIFNCTIHVHSPPFTSGAFQARFRAGPQEEEVRLEKPSRYLWPESAKGFLYYCVPEARHPATGQVRFRCIKRHGSTAFQKGKDLLLSSGLPWSLPVANIIKHKSYQPLLDLLVHENHVSSELVASYTNLQLFPSRGRPVIYALKQPFVWKGTSKRLYLWIAHGDSIQPASFTLTPKFFDKLPPGTFALMAVDKYPFSR